MSLKACVREKVMNDVINSINDTGKKHIRKVLVLDHPSKRMISSCCKMSEIITGDNGLTLVEDLNKKREPLPTLEAVYLIEPTEESLNHIIEDFTRKKTIVAPADPANPKEYCDDPDPGDIGRLYNYAHIFFTERCPDELFLKLGKIRKYVKTCKEINIAFVPLEGQVYSLDSPVTFSLFYRPCKLPEYITNLERCAEQLATMCATLGEYPQIRYRVEFDRNLEFAYLVQRKLDDYKKSEPEMGSGPSKDRSQLLILDRGFDPISPILHELTYQAMVYDLLPVDNDVYRYDVVSGKQAHEKEVLLDETDELWKHLRHQHIASVTKAVTTKLKQFAEGHHMRQAGGKKMDLGAMIKKMPQYQKELSSYATHLSLAENLMRKYTGQVDKLCGVEQDLAMGADAEGERIKEHMKKVVPVLLDQSVNAYQKMRIILLYILQNAGISDENLTKLFEHAQIPMDQKCIVQNMKHIGIRILKDMHGTSSGGKKVTDQLSKGQTAEGKRFSDLEDYSPLKRKERITDNTFQMSRWTPYIKDIMEEAVEERLDPKKYPFLSGSTLRQNQRPVAQAPTSARFGGVKKDKCPTKPTGPRLIVFIVGGMSYSEMRCAYEVTAWHATVKEKSSWEVLIGSTMALQPDTWLDHVRDLGR